MIERWSSSAALGWCMLGGCIPFVVPPGKASVGVGARHYGSGFKGRGTPSGSETSVQVRGALHPLGLARSLHRRSLDFGIGYSLDQDTGKEPTAIHGPFLELGWFPWRTEGENLWRLGTVLSPMLVLSDPGGFDDGLDGGVELRLELEYTGFSGVKGFNSLDDGSTVESDDGVVFGVSYGEWSLGAWVAGGFYSTGDGQGSNSHAFNAWLGISGRWPAVAGMVCCVGFGDDD